MSDNLFERLTDLSIGTGSQTPLAAIDRIKELEAKLAKAVKALQTIKDWSDFRLPSSQNIARTTLAELKGQKDE